MDINQILTNNGIEYAKTNNPYEIKIRCVSGSHDDKEPSLHVNLEKEVFNCFSCGFSGKLSKLFRKFGIELVEIKLDRQPIKIAKLKNKLLNIQNKDVIEIPKDAELYLGDFKGIRAETLKKFGAFITTHFGLSDYLSFPIRQFGRIQFIVARHHSADPKDYGEQKYIIRPTGANVSKILYPIDQVIGNKSIILVEGIFDMLNMHQAGYTNTVCIFGVQNFKKEKLKLIDMFNFNTVYVMMDGDNPGRQAALKIAEMLETINVEVKIPKIPEGKDPGSLTPYEMLEILGPIKEVVV